MKKKTLIPKVVSIYDLRSKAESDKRYLQLALAAANNLGGNVKTLNEAIEWLNINVSESGSESGVIDEINFCRDLV